MFTCVGVGSASTRSTYTIAHPTHQHHMTCQAVIRSALVVFKHGSVVFFNVDEAVQSRYLHALARHCGEVVPQAHRCVACFGGWGLLWCTPDAVGPCRRKDHHSLPTHS